MKQELSRALVLEIESGPHCDKLLESKAGTLYGGERY